MTKTPNTNQDRNAEWDRIAREGDFPREGDLRTVWNAIQAPPARRLDTTNLWQRIDAATRPGNTNQEPPLLRKHTPARNAFWFRSAIGVGIASSFLLFGIFAKQHWGLGSATSAAAHHEITTAIGERAAFQLPDGSSVVLGPSSSLSYPADFGTTTRDILLEGQALFTVVNHTTTPLQVHTNRAVTRVLGTTFTVKHYPGDSSVRVVVAQGKVSLNTTVLGTGDIGTLGPEGSAVVQRDMNVTSALAWAEGKLVFDKVPLREAIPDFQRWYGITLTVADSALLSQRIVLTLSKETPREALEVVAYTLGATLALDGTHAVLSLSH